MKNLGLAVMLEHPEAINGVDYGITDTKDERGERITFWNLPGQPPKNQAAVDQMIRRNEERHIEKDVKNEPDMPTLEDRVNALEDMMEAQGRTIPARQKKEQIRERVRDRIRQGRGPN